MNTVTVSTAAERNATVKTWARYVLCAIAVLAFWRVAFCSGKRAAATYDAIAQSKNITATAEVTRAAAVETVTVIHRQAVKEAAVALAYHDTVTVVARDTVQLLIGPDSVVRVEIPAVVVARIQSTDSLLALVTRESLGKDGIIAIDSTMRSSMQRTIDLLDTKTAPRCGVRCGVVIGATGVVSVLVLVAHLIH